MSDNISHRTTPKDFFLHLGVTAALYVSAISLLRLLFESINTLYPDTLVYAGGFSSASLRWAVASLVVVFPLYLIIARIMYRGIAKHPDKRDISIRKWLTYLTLFVAGVTLAIDLVVLVNYFLGGELTTRFVLKVLAVFVVIGAIFYYYLYDLRYDLSKNARRLRMFAWGGIALTAFAVVAGFLIIGSPATARQQRFDEQRIQDLSTMQWQVVNYWQLKGELPATLDLLVDPLSGFTVPNDPATSDPYEYRVIGERSFELCAIFALSNKQKINSPSIPATPRHVGLDGTWEHDAGRTCFEREIDPELYPPRTNEAIVPKAVVR